MCHRVPLFGSCGHRVPGCPFPARAEGLFGSGAPDGPAARDYGGRFVPGGSLGAVFDSFVSVRHRSSEIFRKYCPGLVPARLARNHRTGNPGRPGAVASGPPPRRPAGGRGARLPGWCGPFSRAPCAKSPDPPLFSAVPAGCVSPRPRYAGVVGHEPRTRGRQPGTGAGWTGACARRDRWVPAQHGLDGQPRAGRACAELVRSLLMYPKCHRPRIAMPVPVQAGTGHPISLGGQVSSARARWSVVSTTPGRARK
jgi:hypothetical protein